MGIVGGKLQVELVTTPIQRVEVIKDPIPFYITDGPLDLAVRA